LWNIRGEEENPSYKKVSSSFTGHTEAVEILYDSSAISYSELLVVFWRNIDPTTRDAQFSDEGPQYRTAIFYHNEEQKQQAERYKAMLEKSRKYPQPIVTQIVPARFRQRPLFEKTWGTKKNK
jgi:methionine-S-sulfoxide reductase